MIPTYNRPEFLTVTLELIEAAKDSERLQYLFAVERGADEKTLEIINRFKLPKTVIRPKRIANKKMRLSYNILNGLREGVHSAERFVFIIEDDIFIADDFFQWHYGVQLDAKRKKPLFCTIASRNENTPFHVTRKPSAYYFGKDTDYHCRGVCFPKAVVTGMILPHVVHDYFKQPRKYIKSFGTWLNEGYCEQAGLIRRIRKQAAEQQGMAAAFPHVPRCFHAGFYGKNRGIRDKRDYDGKLNRVRDVCFDKQKKKRASDRFSAADEPCGLRIKGWTKQEYIAAEEDKQSTKRA